MDENEKAPLNGGGRFLIREASDRDARFLESGLEQLSAESRYSRFFTGMPKLPSAVRTRLSSLDGRRDAAVVAIDSSRADDDELLECPVGVARWSTDHAGVAHLAIVVVDAYQGRGLGSRLLRAIFGLAVERGIDTMHADVLATNRAMRSLLDRFHGVATIDDADPSVVAYEIDTARVS